MDQANEAVREAAGDPVLETQRTKADRARDVSEIRYRRLFESAKDGILILDAQTGQIEDANPFMSELLLDTDKTATGNAPRKPDLMITWSSRLNPSICWKCWPIGPHDCPGSLAFLVPPHTVGCRVERQSTWKRLRQK